MAPDAFGIFREYARRPQRDPEANVSLEAVCDAPRLEKPAEQDAPKYASIAWITRSVAITVNPTPTTPDYGPFQNALQFRLMDYFYGRSDSKSLDALDDLIAVIRSPGFSPDDLQGFTAKKAEHALEVWVSPSGVFSEEDGWHTGSVAIPLPKTGAKYKAEEDAPKFNVSGVIYHQLLPLIKGVVQDSALRFSRIYHWLPHCKFWTPPEPARPAPSHPAAPSLGLTSAVLPTPPSPIRVYMDCYNSNAMLQADAQIHEKLRIPGDTPEVEYVTLPLLFWSDATQLTNFGLASLWPIYLYFSNLSKYVRGRPTEFAAHHLAYIPSVCIFSILHFVAVLKALSSYLMHSRTLTRPSTATRPAKTSSSSASGTYSSKYGSSSSTRSSCAHTNMASCSCAAMGSSAASFPECLHILLTILRSE